MSKPQKMFGSVLTNKYYEYLIEHIIGPVLIKEFCAPTYLRLNLVKDRVKNHSVVFYNYRSHVCISSMHLIITSALLNSTENVPENFEGKIKLKKILRDYTSLICVYLKCIHDSPRINLHGKKKIFTEDLNFAYVRGIVEVEELPIDVNNLMYVYDIMKING